MRIRERFAIVVLLLGVVIPERGMTQSAPVLLWPDGAPGAEGRSSQERVRLTEQGEHIVSNVNFPSITPYVPPRESATGAAIVVVPGGGHTELWMDHEGYRVGQFLADHGIAAFVLKYRLAREPGSPYTIENSALPDQQRAIRLVRSRATSWNIDTHRVGAIGFSAGGDLVARASVHYDAGASNAPNEIDRFSSRPDFVALMYPGLPPGLQPSAGTPPAFLLCGADDAPAISNGLADLYLAFKKARVPVELHIYAGAGHGFGMRASNTGPAAAWPQRLLEWLDSRGFSRNH
jgi:acetyl esterase/lipase